MEMRGDHDMEGWHIRVIVLVVVLVALCSMAEASTVVSQLTVDTVGDSKATMTHYSYLRENKLVASGYASAKGGINGLKTKDTEYLENGRINFGDRIEYYNGEIDGPIPIGTLPNTKSYVSHDLNISFNGDHGSSSFCGEGFFPNNRAIGAAKEISSRDVRGYALGPSYTSSAFNLNAYFDAGPSSVIGTAADYDLHWDADVTDAIVDVHEMTGYTNKSRPSELIDWEQESQIAGTTHVVNDLYVTGLYIPAAGNEDWLPCCSGTRPIYADEDWPNVNQEMIFNCNCPGKSAETLAGSGGFAAILSTSGQYLVPTKGIYAPSKQWYISGYKYPGYYNP
jgi:hypothetical protein